MPTWGVAGGVDGVGIGRVGVLYVDEMGDGLVCTVMNSVVGTGASGTLGSNVKSLPPPIALPTVVLKVCMLVSVTTLTPASCRFAGTEVAAT